MPLYEYTCDYCDSDFEKLSKSGQDTAKCPYCGKPAHITPSLPSPFQWGVYDN